MKHSQTVLNLLPSSSTTSLHFKSFCSFLALCLVSLLMSFVFCVIIETDHLLHIFILHFRILFLFVLIFWYCCFFLFFFFLSFWSLVHACDFTCVHCSSSYAKYWKKQRRYKIRYITCVKITVFRIKCFVSMIISRRIAFVLFCTGPH